MTNSRPETEKRTTSSNSSSNSKTVSSSSSSSTTTTTYSTHPGVFHPLDLENIRTAYEASISSHITAPVAQLIEGALSAGIEPDVVIHAIELTGFAPRPTPWYLRAILRRYQAWGIQTMEDVADDEAELHDQQQRHGPDAWNSWYRG